MTGDDDAEVEITDEFDGAPPEAESSPEDQAVEDQQSQEYDDE